jgi:adenylate kinase
MVNVVILGLPGSGKGTQSRLLSERFGLEVVATGDMLRSAVNSGVPLAGRIRSAIDSGKMITDSMIIDMVAHRLRSGAQPAGYVFDGFPRNLAQAQALEGLLFELCGTVDLVLDLVLSHDIIAERLASRVVCSRCSAVYNSVTLPTRVPGVCDVCGGTELVGRADDDADVLRCRLRSLGVSLDSLRSYYRSGRAKVVVVDGGSDVESVAGAIGDAVAGLLGSCA